MTRFDTAADRYTSLAVDSFELTSPSWPDPAGAARRTARR